MNQAMPQLNEAEHKFFESRGQDVAPALSGGAPEPEAQNSDAAGASAGDQDWTPASAGVTKTEEAGEKPQRERGERFVPLKDLQEERAEKKQLREELKAYREWQAQLAQRLQQAPFTQGAPQPAAPDPKTQPLEYINHVLGNVQNSTAELQQWRQQQEQAAQQRAQLERVDAWMAAHEEAFAKTQPDYRDAYRYAEEAREQELKAIGYTDPAQRAAILRANRLEIMSNAAQQGRNPAELVWEYVRARGFTAKANRGNPGPSEGQAKIVAGMQVAGAKLNQGGETGEGELSAKDLPNISDPEEFEQAWRKIFGKRR